MMFVRNVLYFIDVVLPWLRLLICDSIDDRNSEELEGILKYLEDRYSLSFTRRTYYKHEDRD